MSKFILSNSTIHQNETLIIGDNKILTKKSNLKKIFDGYFINVRDIKDVKLATIDSSHDSEFGVCLSGVYVEEKEKKKPKNFYYIPFNSLKHIEVDNLIKKIDKDGKKTGKVKITSGTICFKATMDSGYKHSQLKNKKTQKKEWNNSFTYKVDNGVFEIYAYYFDYERSESVNYDTMFAVKKKL